MKRLFAYLGLTMVCTFAVVFYFEFVGIIAVGIFSVVIGSLGAFVNRFKGQRLALMFISVVALCCSVYSMLYTSFVFEPKISRYNNQEVELVAEINDMPKSSYGIYFYDMTALSINGNKENIKLSLQSPLKLKATYGDVISTRVLLEQTDDNYYKSKKCYYKASSVDYYVNYEVVGKSENTFGYFCVYIKDHLLQSITTLIPGEEGNISKAIALGDKHSLSSETLAMFENTGLTYLIVVSGLHLSIVAAFVMKLFSKFHKTTGWNFLRCLIVICVVVLFSGISGFTPSVVRSGVMLVMLQIGNMLRQNNDSLNNLGLAGCVLTILNPYAVGDIGMLFSFASVFGIIVVYTPLSLYIKDMYYKSKWKQNADENNMKHKLSRWITDILMLWFDMFLVSAVAVVFVTVISVVFYGNCSPYTALLSLFISPVISVLLICILLCAILWYVPIISNIAHLFALLAFYLSKWLLWVVSVGNSLPYVKLKVDTIYFCIWLVISAFCVLCAYLMRNRRCMKIAVTYSLVLSLFVLPLSYFADCNDKSINIYNCGNGTTVLINSNEGVDILSCGGDGKYTTDTIESISKLNSQVNFLLIPSSRKTESRYATKILEEFDVKSVMLYYSDSTNEKTYSLATVTENYAEFYCNDVYKVNLNNGFVDIVINVNNHTYQYVSNDYISMLILPDNGDCEDVPYQYRTADIVVTRDEPDNIGLLSYGKLIWTRDQQAPDTMPDVENVYKEGIKIPFY